MTVTQPHPRPTYLQLTTSGAAGGVRVRVELHPIRGQVRVAVRRFPYGYPDVWAGTVAAPGTADIKLPAGRYTVRADYEPVWGSTWMASTASSGVVVVP